MSNPVFIDITFDRDRIRPDTAQALVAACPVDIFALADGQLATRTDALDECTLCELCLAIAPAGALVIHKLYKDESLVSRGDANS